MAIHAIDNNKDNSSADSDDGNYDNTIGNQMLIIFT